MRKIDILRIIHRYLKNSTIDRINGGLENKNMGTIRSILREFKFSRWMSRIDNTPATKFDFYNPNRKCLDLEITYNPEIDYCYIGDIKLQMSDLDDVPDEMLILSYGRNILEEIKP